MASWDEETNKPGFRNYHVFYKAPIEDIAALEKVIGTIANRDNLTFSQTVKECFLAGVEALSEGDNAPDCRIFHAVRRLRRHESEMQLLAILMVAGAPEFETLCDSLGIDCNEFRQAHTLPVKITWYSMATQWLYDNVPTDGISTADIKALAIEQNIIDEDVPQQWKSLQKIASERKFSGGQRGRWQLPVD